MGCHPSMTLTKKIPGTPLVPSVLEGRIRTLLIMLVERMSVITLKITIRIPRIAVINPTITVTIKANIIKHKN